MSVNKVVVVLASFPRAGSAVVEVMMVVVVMGEGL